MGTIVYRGCIWSGGADNACAISCSSTTHTESLTVGVTIRRTAAANKQWGWVGVGGLQIIEHLILDGCTVADEGHPWTPTDPVGSTSANTCDGQALLYGKLSRVVSMNPYAGATIKRLTINSVYGAAALDVNNGNIARVHNIGGPGVLASGIWIFNFQAEDYVFYRQHDNDTGAICIKLNGVVKQLVAP